MWKLIKAEFMYNKVPNIILYGFIFLFFLANSIFGDQEERFASYMLFISIIIGIYIAAECQKTGRMRFLAGLPLTVRKLEVYRYVRFMAFWLIWALLLCLSSLISQKGSLGADYYCWVLTKVGCMFFYAGCVGLALNIIYCGKNSGTGRVLLWLAGMILVLIGIIMGLLLFFYTIFSPFFYSVMFSIAALVSLSEFLLTFHGSFGIFFLGFVLIVLNIYTFGMRRTYAEESDLVIIHP